ncbi:hypothetical protein V1520DRAFT_24169 [Lipomyces starkeyi]|uniref:C2H2-type domain-containing protein n=1 Tax=Lipomyces starkeyi NRRL Y-11557 TaxID=675824 RepID=A0A1E3Q0D9_LIPST|nr:hypothetical protein LIPSTDRAFT_147746 [Lipomyces starkeyi NRRL Y-11557]
MGKKKSTTAALQELLQRPWCYYCERDFDDLKVLISHQRAQHFKCDRCNKRLNTAGGLVIHVQQVHKETITTVFNSTKGRERADIEIFGLEGIPEEAVQAHEAKIREKFSIPDSITSYTSSPAVSSARTSLSPPPAKKQKVASINREEIQARLAAHKAAKKAAAEGKSSASPPSSSNAPSVSQIVTVATSVSSATVPPVVPAGFPKPLEIAPSTGGVAPPVVRPSVTVNPVVPGAGISSPSPSFVGISPLSAPLATGTYPLPPPPAFTGSSPGLKGNQSVHGAPGTTHSK